jgi:diguanylate cyclase (GGDEF)-like protein
VRSQDLPHAALPGTRAGQLARIVHLASAIAAALVEPGGCAEAMAAIPKEAAPLGISEEALHQLFDTIRSEWREAGTIYSVSTREVTSLTELRAPPVITGGAIEAPDVPSPAPVAAPQPRTDPLHIMIVDDDPDGLRVLERQLSAAGYRVTTASSGLNALEIDRAQAPQMIITDWMMPELDGLELCRRLRRGDESGHAYIIVLTASREENRTVEALEAGADDFLTKPYNRHELLARVRAGERIVRLEAGMAERSREVSRYNARLAAANDQLRIMATTDELTGLANRREALARLAEHWSLAVRHGDPLACVIADIDHFKRFNDALGHAVGDAVLKATAEVLRKTARAGEAVCRIGGEEFLLICPRSRAQSAEVAAERLRSSAAAHVIQHNGNSMSVTLSLGVAERTERMAGPDDLLKAADDALYAAKRAGRNRVCVCGQVPPARAHRSTDCPTASVEAAAAVAQADGAPLRVLIVDDDAQVRALCRGILEREGHVVSEASDGLEALRAVTACSPDIIVMDALMPNLDGLECTRRLRAAAATRDIPVIMLSAATETESIAAGLEAGADEYITKPLKPREFALRVRSMARLHRSKAELVWSNEIRWQQARALQVLLDLSCSLVGAADLDTILGRIVSAAAELTWSRRVSIMLPDSAGALLTIARCIGMDEQAASAIRVPVGAPIAGQVFATGQPVIANSAEEAGLADQRYDSPFFASAPLVSRAMLAGNRTVGVLNITARHDRRPFSAAELESIELLCNVAANAINDLLSRASRDRARDSVVVTLATLAEYRDTHTGRHLERVTRYALLLAQELRADPQFHGQLDDMFLQSLRRAMPLHDIGKVAIPDGILLKPGKLTAAEMAAMKHHAELGANTIQSIIDRGNEAGFLVMARQIARSHHEWYDGAGYPDGLSGESIPLAARIAAVADVYDALTSRRPYKNALAAEAAGEIIRRASGTQFDPAAVEAFKRREGEFAAVAQELTDEEAGNQSTVAGGFVACREDAHAGRVQDQVTYDAGVSS